MEMQNAKTLAPIHPAKQEITIIDAHDLMQKPADKMQWAVDGLLPAGVVCDIFGPPGAGKSTLITDLALAIASETSEWHGKSCVGGAVAILGGERTDKGALSRDFHRSGRPSPPPGALVVPVDRDGDCPPLWRWDKKAEGGSGRWDLTRWGQEITDWATSARLAMVVVDTIASAASGSDLLDQPQQYALGQTIRRWAKQIGTQITVTVSHTNQSSSAAGTRLHERLDYLSRAGGNGFPGSLRHLGGLTRLRQGEVPGLELSGDRTMFAFGFSKHNESPPAKWTHHAPAIFSQRSGRVEMVLDGEEVAQRFESADQEEKRPDKRKGEMQTRALHAVDINKYQAIKNGRVAHEDDEW